MSKLARLQSVDALRGFDMIWILGAESLFAALLALTGWQGWQWAAAEMQHSPWHGFTFYDLIFPLFIFLSGVSLGLASRPFSELNKQQKREKYQHAVKRLLLLIFLGVVYNHGWGTGMPVDPEHIRFASVLSKIAIAWFVAAMLVWHLSLTRQIAVTVGLLLIYALLQSTLTLSYQGQMYGAQFGPEYSLNAWVDQMILPGIRYQNLAVDPEGLLSNLGSIVNAMIGVFAGRAIRQKQAEARQLLLLLTFSAAACWGIGWIWGLWLPVNKTLWTSSFALVTSGWSLALLAAFYAIIDVLKWQRWAKLFTIIGVNSIVIYIASSLVNWQYLAQSLFGGVIALGGKGEMLLSVLALLTVQCVFVWFLYRRQIFIKI